MITKQLGYEYEVKPIQYANRLKNEINKFLKTLKLSNDQYLYISDLDAFPCVTKRKEKVMSIHTETETEKIKVVKKMIESWYIAGINQDGSHVLNVWPPSNTENIGKTEIHRDYKPKELIETVFLIKLLEYFSLEQASRRNHSFRYFMDCLNTLERY